MIVVDSLKDLAPFCPNRGEIRLRQNERIDVLGKPAERLERTVVLVLPNGIERKSLPLYEPDILFECGLIGDVRAAESEVYAGVKVDQSNHVVITSKFALSSRAYGIRQAAQFRLPIDLLVFMHQQVSICQV